MLHSTQWRARRNCRRFLVSMASHSCEFRLEFSSFILFSMHWIKHVLADAVRALLWNRYPFTISMNLFILLQSIKFIDSYECENYIMKNRESIEAFASHGSNNKTVAKHGCYLRMRLARRSGSCVRNSIIIMIRWANGYICNYGLPSQQKWHTNENGVCVCVCVWHL